MSNGTPPRASVIPPASVAEAGHPSWSNAFEANTGEEIRTHFIVRDELANANAAADLVTDRYCESAEAIVVVTHLPKSAAAKLFQHFTANLLSVAKCPVVAVNANAPILTNIKKILFITDLASSEKEQFRRALGWAKRFDAELVIGNCLLSPWELNQSALPRTVFDSTMIDESMMKEAHEAHEKAGVLIEEARELGVRASFEHVSGHLSVSSGMLEAAKDLKADLIILSRNNKSRIVAALIGSTVLEMLAEAFAPVMVLPQLSAN